MAGLEIIIVIIIFLFSVIIHELAHGSMALALGDLTAQRAGRLTLNPIKHLDPIGSILLPGILILMNFLGAGGIIFGWAKPVPVNPYNFKDKRWGSAKVAAAGPLANICLAVIFGLAIRFVPIISSTQGLFLIFLYIVQINFILAIFNLMPIPPLDGSHILFSVLPKSAQNIKIALSRHGLILLLFVIFFLFQYIIKIVTWLTALIIGF